ncbi:MAG: HNH endonuclease [Microcystaceae cyanobacterium]
MRKKRRKRLQRYSPDWKAIALAKKQAVNWTCQECGRVCLNGKSSLSLSDRKRLELAVHHWDCDPLNNSPDNLIALCSSCHLRKHQRRQGNITPGQLKLPLGY